MRYFVFIIALLLGGCSVERPPTDFAGVEYVGSAGCADCHEERHESWSKTFHRTMTQSATEASVQGRFDGVPVSMNGATVRPVRDGGGYFFEYLDGNQQALGRIEVERTVGSNRYQQYLGRAQNGGQNYYRLEMLWHNQERRWVPMSGAFFGLDSERSDAHFTTWDQNCIFCHNTGPEPRIQNLNELRARASAGEQVNFPDEAKYQSHVAELGIGCESCHGPGAAHVQANANFFRRMSLKLSGGVDSTVINPKRLSAARATDICGACHAQRQPKALEMVDIWLTRGPTFRPGQALRDHVTPVGPETPAPADQPDLFRQRFWADGVPRLSAYEYQSFEESACLNDAPAFSCTTCHSMHAGDPRGMLTDANRSDAPCARCHQDLSKNAAAHSGHAADSAGAQCLNCHMPKIVYGVMEIHRSHRIEKPDPEAAKAADRPDACSACHLTWSTAKIVAKMNKTDVPSGGTARHLELLFGGDPVERAVAANQPFALTEGLSEPAAHAEMAALNVALSDPYAAVRRFSWRSMTKLNNALAQPLLDPKALASFDYMQPASPAPFALGPPLIDPSELARLQLRARAQSRQIVIGE